MNETTHILYITNDGITDPLGRSQILPYLTGLADSRFRIRIISCEKPHRYKNSGHIIQKLLEQANICWTPVKYRNRIPLISAVATILSLRKNARKLIRQNDFHIVHVRSYIPALIGLHLKRKKGIKFLFDMRGFWADERKDGKIWNLKNPVYKMIYRFFLRKEAEFFSESDHIISLTHKGKEIICDRNYPDVSCDKISVIPCCADYKYFLLSDIAVSHKCREELNIPKEALVVTYLGSFGTWYMLDEMLQTFAGILEKYPSAVFFFISNDPEETITRVLAKYHIPPDNVRFVSAGREKVPFYLSCSDLGISFIQPCFSKNASSPTRIAEMLAMGIPVIVNTGVGDMDSIFGNRNFGYILGDFTNEEIKKCICDIDRICNIPKSLIREESRKLFDAEIKGIDVYRSVYLLLSGTK